MAQGVRNFLESTVLISSTRTQRESGAALTVPHIQTPCIAQYNGHCEMLRAVFRIIPITLKPNIYTYFL